MRITVLILLFIFHAILIATAADTSNYNPNVRTAFNIFIAVNTIAFSYIADLNMKLKVAISERERVEQQQQEQFKNLQMTKDALEKAIAEVQIANQAKSIFIANMNHELRTPLSIILGQCEIIKDSSDLPAVHQDNFKVIFNNADYLLSLINNILELSKIEAGKSVIAKEHFNLSELLHGICQMFLLKANSKGLELVFDMDLSKVHFYCDSVKIRQILANLIDNAIKFTESGTVKVYATNRPFNETSETVFFEVSDTGVGMYEEEVEESFLEFHQTQSGKNSKKGTGLGLSICRKFIELLGGSITVNSQPKIGTVFQFSIVMDIGKERLPINKPKDKTIAIEESKYRVLIVDDQPLNRNILSIFLKTYSIEVKEACNGQEAINIWEIWRPHMIWMDIMMPVMNGYEAIRKIRSYDEETLIIGLTASSLDTERNSILEAGCNECLGKPYRKKQILECTAKYLDLGD